MNFKFFLILTVVGIILCNPDEPDRKLLKEIFYWDIVDYELPTDRREQALASGSFIPNKNAIMSFGVWHDKMFVGVFRFGKGIASSLNYFSLNTTNKSPLLIPYPSFDANYVNEDPNNRTVHLSSESSVINAGHFKIDHCDRLWIMDGGYTDQWGEKRIIAPPAIVIFDLNTNTLIRRFVIPAVFINPISIFPSITLDFTSDSCNDVFAYIPDMLHSIIVYSITKNKAWIVEHNFMGSDPHQGNFHYEHLNFQWNYGIYALTVGDKQDDGSKRVYFTALASTKIYYVSNRVLQDESYKLNKYYYDFHLLGDVGKDGHATQMLYDNQTNVIFNNIFGRTTIGCWNTRLPFQSVSTVHKSSQYFFPIAMLIDANQNFWVLSNRIALNFYEKFEPGMKNLRIFKETLNEVMKGSNCNQKLKL